MPETVVIDTASLDVASNLSAPPQPPSSSASTSLSSTTSSAATVSPAPPEEPHSALLANVHVFKKDPALLATYRSIHRQVVQKESKRTSISLVAALISFVFGIWGIILFSIVDEECEIPFGRMLIVVGTILILIAILAISTFNVVLGTFNNFLETSQDVKNSGVLTLINAKREAANQRSKGFFGNLLGGGKSRRRGTNAKLDDDTIPDSDAESSDVDLAPRKGLDINLDLYDKPFAVRVLGSDNAAGADAAGASAPVEERKKSLLGVKLASTKISYDSNNNALYIPIVGNGKGHTSSANNYANANKKSYITESTQIAASKASETPVPSSSDDHNYKKNDLDDWSGVESALTFREQVHAYTLTDSLLKSGCCISYVSVLILAATVIMSIVFVKVASATDCSELAPHLLSSTRLYVWAYVGVLVVHWFYFMELKTDLVIVLDIVWSEREITQQIKCDIQEGQDPELRD